MIRVAGGRERKRGGLPLPYKALPSSAHFVVRQLVDVKLFLDFEVEREYRFVLREVMLANARGIFW